MAASRFAGRFELLQEHSKGGTATIHKAFDFETHKVVALKIFTSENRDIAVVNEIWNREHTALSQLDHPSVVQLVDAGRSEETSERFIALEWVDGLTLEAHLRQTGPQSWEEFFAKVGEPILNALVYAAERNIAHRDLSTGNILVTPDGRVKIIDFGQAKLKSPGVGVTLMGWKTVPYCLPEDDTGTYTLTRDPYAWCAIAVRAVSGVVLEDHEQLYERLENVPIPDAALGPISRALSRNPPERYKTIIEFSQALAEPITSAAEEKAFTLSVRLAPGVAERIDVPDQQLDASVTTIEILLEELNDVVAVSPARDADEGSGKVQLDTKSFRINATVDRVTSDHFVITNVVRKRFRLDAMFQAKRWIPPVVFSSTLPRKPDEKRLAAQNVERFYAGLDLFLDESRRSEGRDAEGNIAAWGRLLEALRFLAKTSTPPLRYSRVNKEGSRLVAVVENPEDAQDEQLRIISVERSWVFRGEVESVRENKCTLLSTRPNFSIERIPSKGLLEIDWQQTRVALDRQGRAVEKFKVGDTPNVRLRRIVTGEDSGPAEPDYSRVSFFDESLDDAKRAVVSRFVAGADLLVTHGPPGTGKTKLIVELIRQAIKTDPDCRVLLASQTHVALDNALQRLLVADTELTCVRIGSGTKESDPRVARSTLEQRSSELREQVTRSAHEFLEERAKELGIKRSEVELGLAVLDLLGASSEHERAKLAYEAAQVELQKLEAEITNDSDSTSERTAREVRGKVIEEELETCSADLTLAVAETRTAREALSRLGKDGAELSTSGVEELREWSQLLLGDENRRALGELMELAEDWKLRFGQSDDFKSAIILSSSVVAGTCVGFCREEAALRTTFDLCIVDEAGKATTTELLVPLAQSRRAVLLGDHHQLPAVLDHSLKTREITTRFELSQQQLDEQLFEKLTKDLSEGCKASLTIQYRMRGEIGRLVSECFYDGMLKEDESLQDRQVPDLAGAGLESEVTWIDPYSASSRSYAELRRGTSFENAQEARAIIELLARLHALFSTSLVGADWPSIAVISGYSPQVSLIRNEIRKRAQLDDLNVECASVHSFQGREVDICIYSVTRKNERGQIGMLKDWRHLNVALSRAKNFLVIVGGVEFCKGIEHDNPFSRLIAFIEDSPTSTIKEWSDD